MHELAERLTTEVAERIQELDGEITKEEAAAKERLARKISEREELQGLLARMGSSTKSESAPAPSAPPAPNGRRTRARKQRNGKRADQFVQFVREHPGARVSEAAAQLGVKPNYLYRVAADEVDKHKRLRKEGTQYFVTAKGGGTDGEETS